jgi:hypothetical protein
MSGVMSFNVNAAEYFAAACTFSKLNALAQLMRVDDA